MATTKSQQAYAQGVGTTPTGGIYVADRNPNTNDTNYQIGQFWLYQSAQRLYYLDSLLMDQGVLSATWVVVSVDTVLDTLSDDNNIVVDASDGGATPPYNIQLKGGVGITVTADPANNLLTFDNTQAADDFTTDEGTNPVTGASIFFTNTDILATGSLTNAIRSNSTAPSTIAYQTQYAGSTASTSAASKWGVSQFDANQFTVTSGFVQLAGGTTAPVLSLTPDAHTPPGTTPTLPTAGGTITIEGGTLFATGTNAFAVRTNSLAASKIDIQLQRAGSNAATSTANNFGVSQFDANQFTVTSGFVQVIGGGTTGAITQIKGDDTLAVVPTAGVVNLTGTTVVNATHAKPVYFLKNATSIEELDVQLATTSTSGAKSINKSGLSHFDSTAFTIDSMTGFVGLVGGSLPAIQTLTGNSGGAIGPNGSGNVNVIGASPGSITIVGSANTLTAQLTGLTQYNVLLGQGSATIGLAAPGATGIPLISTGAAAYPAFGTATVPGGGTGNTSFTAYSVICAGTTSTGAFQNVSGVGTANQILTSNGAGSLPTWQASSASGAVTQFTLDAATTPISPSAGNITITGGQVATGVVGTNVIRTRGNTSSSCTIEIQRSTVAASQDQSLNGVSHFNSAQFSVSSQGFVSFTGSTSSFPWTDEGAPFTAAVNNGYFLTAATTATLPLSPSQGDVIRFAADFAGVMTIQANTAQLIRIGNVVSSAAGTAISTRQGDSINLVYRLSSKTWMAVSSTGTWGVT